MTTTSNLTKIVPKWIQFQKQLKAEENLLNFECVWLIGTQNSGRSTLCQLFEAEVAKNNNNGLIFKDDGKIKMYQLQDVISSNTFSIQTIQPKLYKVESKLQHLPNRNIVDVPTFAIQPFSDSNKKIWTPFESKLTFSFLLNMAKKNSFVFVIDDKFTRAPMQAVKATMTSFVEAFEQHPRQLLNSTAIMISKSATFKPETFITRIEAWAKKLTDKTGKALDEWIQNLKERNAFLVFNKAVSDEATRSQAVAIYEQISKLEYSYIQPNIINSFKNWPEDQKQQLKKYLSGLQSGFSQLIKIVLQITDGLIKDQQQFQEEKNKLSKSLFGLREDQNIQVLPLPQDVAIMNVCCQSHKIIESQKENPNIFNLILSLFVKNKVLSQKQELYLNLKQRTDFYNFFWKHNDKVQNWDELAALKIISEQANKIKQFKKASEILKDSYKQGQSKQFYSSLISTIQFFVSPQQLQSHQLLSVWINSTLQIAAQLEKPKALTKFLELQSKLRKWKKLQLIGNLLAKIAQLLISLNKVAFAVSLFNKCGNPYKGIQIMSTILNGKDIKKQYSIKDFVPYLELLQEIGLYEKSYETCYFLGNLYDTIQQRVVLRPFLQKAPSGPKKDTVECFVEKKIKGLQQKETDQLILLAKELEKKNI